MKKFLIAAFTGLGVVGSLIVLTPQEAQAYYEAAWAFVCDWECGEADFPGYGGYTVHGYAEAFHDELPDSEGQAATWAYYDYWQPAGCEALSTNFSQTVCLDTAYMYGVEGWRYFSSLYQGYSDDELACAVIDERSYWRDNDSAYVWGWMNRDADLAAEGGCWG